MKQIRQTREAEEPIGIVISGGARDEVTPRFAAFVWGPAPEPNTAAEPNESRAA